jgi:hypothetical protein
MWHTATYATPAPPTATPTLVPPTAPPPVPPCFRLVQVDKLPDWFGGLAFGEKHSIGGGVWDLTSMVGCEVEGGVIAINRDGRLFMAYVDDCASFHSSDIPQELRPAVAERWVCVELTGDGEMQFIPRHE